MKTYMVTAQYMKNILDDTAEDKNEDVLSITSNYEVDDVHKKSALNEAPRFESVKEPGADNLMFEARLLHHDDVARLNIFKRFHRFLRRPGDPCYPSYSVLFVNTAIHHVFQQCCVFTITVLNMSCTGVNKQAGMYIV